MNGCIYRTKDGECDLYSEGGKFKAYCDMEHCDNIAPTNADRIRAMTDEEMAEFCAGLGCHPGASRETCKGVNQCQACWLDWLRQEANT